MTQRKQFTVSRGGKVEVAIATHSSAKPRGSDKLIGREEHKKNVIPYEQEDDQYVFRKGEITFYDLGTRLRSTPDTGFDRLRRIERDEIIQTEPQDGYYNEYLELDLEKGKNINSFGITLEEISGIEAELFHGDPLGKSRANTSNPEHKRDLPHCAQLPYNSEWMYIDAVLYSGDQSQRHALSSPGQRANVNDAYDAAPQNSDKWKSVETDISEERWNSFNLSAQVVGNEGVLKSNFSGNFLKVECLSHFEVFDTGDSSLYKWTNGPSYGAGDVGTVKLGRITRVFLRPRIQHTAFGYVMLFADGPFGTPGQAQILSRFPFYPLIGKLIREPFGIAGHKMIMTRGFARATSAALERSQILVEDREDKENGVVAIHGGGTYTRYNGNATWTGGMGFSGHSQPIVEGMLVAIIETDDQVFYGWARQAVDTIARRIFTVGPANVSLLAGASLPIDEWQCPPQMLWVGNDDETTEVANPDKLYQD